MIKFTLGLELFKLDRILDATGFSSGPSIKWHGVRLGHPDWASWSHTLSFELIHREAAEHLFVMLNLYKQDLSFQIPHPSANRRWYRIADTSLPAPDDFRSIEDASQVATDTYSATSYSVTILLAQ
jgi:glycogen operon protein